MIANIRLHPTYVSGKKIDFGNICVMDILFFPEFFKKYVFSTSSILSDFLIIKKINEILINQITRWDKKEIFKAITSIEGLGLKMIYTIVEYILCETKAEFRFISAYEDHNNNKNYTNNSWLLKTLFGKNSGHCKLNHKTSINKYNNTHDLQNCCYIYTNINDELDKYSYVYYYT